MSLIDNAVPGGSISKPLIVALLALVASGALFGGGNREHAPTKSGGPPPSADEGSGLLEGLGGLRDRFRQGGLGKAADSWVGTGPNEQVSPGQVGNALGPNIIKTLAQQSGISEEELLRQLSRALPGIADRLTPKGRIPTLAELDQ
jgi:uncharacterized protein YidB (DUF937 family)